MGKDDMMFMGIGAVAIVGGLILFWDKICPVLNMCGVNEKVGGLVGDAGQQAKEIISGGPDDENEEDKGETTTPPPPGEVDDANMERKMGVLGPGDEPSETCCVCRWDGRTPKCNAKIGGPWKRYRTAMKIKDPVARMQKSIQICNKHCPKYKRKGNRIVKANHAFLSVENDRMSI